MSISSHKGRECGLHGTVVEESTCGHWLGVSE